VSRITARGLRGCHQFGFHCDLAHKSRKYACHRR